MPSEASQATAPRPIPDGYGAVTPWIISVTPHGYRLRQDAFGAVELGRMPRPDGGIDHAEVRSTRAA